MSLPERDPSHGGATTPRALVARHIDPDERQPTLFSPTFTHHSPVEDVLRESEATFLRAPPVGLAALAAFVAFVDQQPPRGGLDAPPEALLELRIRNAIMGQLEHRAADPPRGEHTRLGHSPRPRVFADSPRPSSQNTALHALMDSLPVMPTLSARSLPSFSFSAPSMPSIFCMTPNDSGSSEEDEAAPQGEKEVKDDPLKRLTGNIVVLGGYRGSILRDAKTLKRIWIPLRVGFGLRKPDLAIGLTDEVRSLQQVHGRREANARTSRTSCGRPRPSCPDVCSWP